MRTLIAVAIAAVAVSSSPAPRAASPNWHIHATVAESCSCTLPCPCNFGGEPNRNPCEGNRLIAIQSGHYEDVDLAGVSFLVTFQMRGWSKIYVTDRVTDRQMKAVDALLPIAFAGFRKGMLSLSRAPIGMDITEDKVTFSSPESSVEMAVVRGLDGQPIRVLNLPSAAYRDYTQYKSVVHKHTSADHKFSYSGTNGFTSTMDVGSRPE